MKLFSSVSCSHPCLLFAPQTMNKVFEHAGDLVNVKVAHNLMRLIAEGFGEDDETADAQLRFSAVCNLDIAPHIYLSMYIIGFLDVNKVAICWSFYIFF